MGADCASFFCWCSALVAYVVGPVLCAHSRVVSVALRVTVLRRNDRRLCKITMLVRMQPNLQHLHRLNHQMGSRSSYRCRTLHLLLKRRRHAPSSTQLPSRFNSGTIHVLLRHHPTSQPCILLVALRHHLLQLALWNKLLLMESPRIPPIRAQAWRQCPELLVRATGCLQIE